MRLKERVAALEESLGVLRQRMDYHAAELAAQGKTATALGKTVRIMQGVARANYHEALRKALRASGCAGVESVMVAVLGLGSVYDGPEPVMYSSTAAAIEALVTWAKSKYPYHWPSPVRTIPKPEPKKRK